MGEGYLGKGYPMHQRWARSECYPECEPPRVNVVRKRPVSQGVWNDTISRLLGKGLPRRELLGAPKVGPE